MPTVPGSGHREGGAEDRRGLSGAALAAAFLIAGVAGVAAASPDPAAALPGAAGRSDPGRAPAAAQDPTVGPAVRIGGQAAAESLLRSVLERRAEVRPVEGALTFRQLITTESLSAGREVVGTADALYEYTPVAGRHLWKLLERDGTPITGRDLRREERRYRKAVRDAVREAQEDADALERSDPDYEVAPKNGMDLFYKIVRDAMELEMFEGDLVEGPPLGGRTTRIVRFRPRPGFRGAPNRMMSVVSKGEGELWVDPASLQVARVRARLTEGENFVAGLFGRLYAGTSADVESGFDGRIWLPHRVTLTVNARMYFFRRIRRRVHYDFLDFRTLTASRE